MKESEKSRVSHETSSDSSSSSSLSRPEERVWNSAVIAEQLKKDALRIQQLIKQAKNLCEGYEEREKGVKDPHKAFLLFQEAAQIGNSDAQCCLGCCYRNGYGTHVNYEKARYWYDEASSRGSTRALRHIAMAYESGQGVPKSYEKAFEFYSEAAKMNDKEAQCCLGFCYEYGQGVPKNYEKAVEWYTKAATQGLARAQCNLGVCHEEGHGVPQSYEKAVEWYTKAAEQGYAKAQWNLGFLYAYGKGVPQNYEKAIIWHTKAAEQQYEMTSFDLLHCNLKYQSVPKSYEKAVEWYTKAAEQGDYHAKYLLGYCYFVLQSYEKAVEWYAKAAEQGYAKAQRKLVDLGNRYYYGRGIAKSYEKAADCFSKSLMDADLDAAIQYDLGYRYANGCDVPQNYEKAVRWYTMAAKQEDRRAQNNLGVCYEYGWGVSRSYEKAAELYTKASEQGVSIAKCNLGHLYEEGKGVPRNYEVAVCWYALSAILGNARGQYHLGYCNEIGRGTPQSLEGAIYWYTKAAEQGNKFAQERLEELLKKDNSISRNIEEGFNQHQQATINLSNGHHLVLAPPGCGKTRVLAERVTHAIDHGVKVEDMLCLTFTNRAAREMRERINKRIGNDNMEELFVGNVHHFCSSILRNNRVIPQKTTIIDDEEKTVILREIVRRCLNINVRNVEEYYLFQHLLYQLKNHYPDELITRPELKKHLNDERYIEVAREYLSYKNKYDIIDFEDLLLLGYDYLLSCQDEVKHYSWIQVDEVQDLNRLQLAIVELVTANENPCVVYLGDEQQAIYSFMGAKLETLSYLKERCNSCILHFHGNYRSPKYLLDVFNKYAEINLHADRALLPLAQGENTDMQKPEDGLLIESCEKREGFNDWDYCSYDLAVDRALSYADGRTAILTYTNANCDKIGERLDKKGIEYFKISGTDFLWTKEIKLLFSHMNVFTQPDNIMSWARILLGIGAFKKMEDAHSFISEASNCYLRVNDLLTDEPTNTPKWWNRLSRLISGGDRIIKNFIHDYPNEFVIFDTETTGLDVNYDDVVEIAAIRINDGIIVDELDIMLYTEKTIPSMLGDTVNPLPDEYRRREKMARDKGLLMFLEWVRDVPVLAHNAKYDFQILDANLKRDCGISNLSQRWQRVHDSLAITRIIEPQLFSYKLKDLLATFHLSGKNSHLAIDDVKATKSLVDYCYQKTCCSFGVQNDFFVKNQETINLIKERYGELYQHTLSVLSKTSESVEGNIFAAEVNYAYRFFREKGIIGELKKMKYLLTFLENDFIVDHKEKSLQQLLDQYMVELNTLRESDLCDSKSLRGKVNVYVSTVHRAKGLEFDNVIVFDVRDGAYPHFEWNEILAQSNDPVKREKALYGRQEDARKLYVAISRAKKRLCIQYPQKNSGIGKYGWYCFPADPSPFMACIREMFTSSI